MNDCQSPQAAEPLYRQIMGPAFDALPEPLRRFHSLAGTHELRGWVEVEAPASRAAKCLAWCLGAPRHAQSGPLRFQLDAQPRREIWTRQFPARTMRSQLSRKGQRMVEQLGPTRLHFELIGGADTLAMKLVRLELLGMPCPGWLMPHVMAEETASHGRLHFLVVARVPGIGTVARYHGHLALDG